MKRRLAERFRWLLVLGLSTLPLSSFETLAKPLSGISESISSFANDPLWVSRQQRAQEQTGVMSFWARGVTRCVEVIAVLDTGMDLKHEDLQANFLRDARGTVIGFNALLPGASPQDDHWHGTAVGGLIGAVGNNKRGISGMCQDARLMPVKVLDRDGAGSISSVVRGIDWSSRNGARILNNSYTTVMTLTKTEIGVHPLIRQAFELAQQRGSIAVLSAGNSAQENRLSAKFPRASNMIYVGALNDQGRRAEFSNFSKDSVHVMAPGTSLVSTYPGSRYVGSLRGTSFAAPLVTGGLALLLSANTKLWSAGESPQNLFKLFLSAQSVDRQLVPSSLSGRFLSLQRLDKLY